MHIGSVTLPYFRIVIEWIYVGNLSTLTEGIDVRVYFEKWNLHCIVEYVEK